MNEFFENFKILIVDDDEKGALLLQKGLSITAKLKSETIFTGEKAIENCLLNNYDAILLDLNLPGIDGFEVLQKIKIERPYLPIIITTGHNEIQTAIKAIKLGAIDYLTKPLDIYLVINTLKRAFEHSLYAKKDDAEKISDRISEKNQILSSNDSPMRNIIEMAKKVAMYDSSVLINGESGTGKELLSKFIHSYSKRAKQAFIEINCGAIPHDLMESEFFGHVKGSFTGAHETKEGLFSIANKGTIFLDEIGEMPLSMQVKLLRTLQSGEVRKTGSTNITHVDVRVIAATSKIISDEVQKGNFREDLFYRLNVINILIPPLRERIMDIPFLVNHFLKTLHVGAHSNFQIEDKALNKLMNHSWPGNIRELKNVIERLMLFSSDNVIRYNDVSNDVSLSSKVGFKDSISLTEDSESLLEVENRHIQKVLNACNGNKTQAARILGITTQTLYNKLTKQDEKGCL